MLGVQLNTNLKRFLTILMVLVCIPSFLFSFSFDSHFGINDTQTSYINQTVGFENDNAREPVLSAPNKFPITDVFFQQTESSQIIQHLSNVRNLSNRRNNGCKAVIFELLYSFLFIGSGNVVGSNIFNILFVLGLSGVIAPLAIDGGMIIDTLALIAGSLIVLLFAYTGKKVVRLEGCLMVMMYCAYMVYIIIL